jgi:rSAM/selenodomain-associated transferase 1
VKVICIILKAPRLGTVKTRLARDIGIERATLVYRAMVEHQAKEIPPGWNVSVHFSPPDAGKEMEVWLKPRLSASARFVPQCDGDLGQRLAAAIRFEFQWGAKRVFLVGGDCPSICHDYFADADSYLDKADLAIGPATDGGYVLLGLKDQHPGLFENIAWGSSAVLAQTLANASRGSLSIGLLSTLEDIDDAASLRRQSRFLSLSPFDISP